MTKWVPGAFYIAKSERHSSGRPTVVQVSTVFGESPEYWTLVTVGSEQHHMISDFEPLSRIELPESASIRQAAE